MEVKPVSPSLNSPSEDYLCHVRGLNCVENVLMVKNYSLFDGRNSKADHESASDSVITAR